MYWIKVPGPGEFRGEGKWHQVSQCEYEECADNWLPKFYGETPPN